MTVPYIPPVCHASDIPSALDDAQIQFNDVKHVCWPSAFPYAPNVKFRIAHTGDCLLLHYVVEEQFMRAICGNDNEPVWQDSCVEFFFSPAPSDGLYYNLECNCIGALLLGCGQPKRFGARQRAEAVLTGQITRWTSLGRKPFGKNDEYCQWQLALHIPSSVFWQHELTTFHGLQATANVYKCGDLTTMPHYLAWHNIETPKPDFHRPEFFGKLLFE